MTEVKEKPDSGYLRGLLVPCLVTLIAVVFGWKLGYQSGQSSITPPPIPTVDGPSCWYQWAQGEPQSHVLMCRSPGERYR